MLKFTYVRSGSRSGTPCFFCADPTVHAIIVTGKGRTKVACVYTCSLCAAGVREALCLGSLPPPRG